MLEGVLEYCVWARLRSSVPCRGGVENWTRSKKRVVANGLAKSPEEALRRDASAGAAEELYCKCRFRMQCKCDLLWINAQTGSAEPVVLRDMGGLPTHNTMHRYRARLQQSIRTARA